MRKLECYDVFEVSIKAKVLGNPFTDYEIFGVFTGQQEEKRIRGFYDGEDTFKVRFMPSFTGGYKYELEANFPITEAAGEFAVMPAGKGNHGPVRVSEQFHFTYSDGTKYLPVGTTCYAWHLQDEEMQQQTLETLSKSPFNKLRFCILPKHYRYNLKEPVHYPYEKRPEARWKPEDFKEEILETIPGNSLGGIPVMIEEPETVWDYQRFYPPYFRHVEECICRLGKLGIEADVILFHPYDRWGYSKMGKENENFYLRYIVARLAAFRNVWWSLANEYDLFREKPLEDWEENALVLVKEDPYFHLRSIHNCMRLYDHTKEWITHCSIQRTDLYKTAENTIEWRKQFGKPVVLDEIGYEGNFAYGWGNISGEEMTRRFWEAYMRGGYACHGETYIHPQNRIWWSHGGELRGSSTERIAFLKSIMEEMPGDWVEPVQGIFDETVVTEKRAGTPEDYYLYYYGANRPSEREFLLPENKRYEAQLIDTWNMKIWDCGEVTGRFTLKMPGVPYMAARFIAS